MTTFNPAESLHRLVKEALDSGAAASLEEAEALFRGYSITFIIRESEVNDSACQAALVTGVTLARRVFLGGVSVVGELNVPLNVPLPFLGATLAEAVLLLGGRMIANAEPNSPIVTIGGGPQSKINQFHIRAVFSGWRGGIVPANTETSLQGDMVMPLAPMMAVAFSINEAFLFVRRETGAAGHRSVGLSLWKLGDAADWLSVDSDGPSLRYLPSCLWLIGLGHLGQAYLWGLGLLPYSKPDSLHLVLQDIDIITPSTESTSVLSDINLVGQKKTRAMAGWSESRGFKTSIHERRFDGSFRRQRDEPSIALCGLDNAIGRQALDSIGFDFVVETGLGRGFRDFRTIRLHTLPSTRPAATIWKNGAKEEDLSTRAAYQRMREKNELDRCGITLLAGKAVGAPFVGAIAACLAISEVLRLLHCGQISQLIDMDLQDTEFLTAVPQVHDFSSLNPGFITLD